VKTANDVWQIRLKIRPLSSILFFICNTKLKTLVLSPPSPTYDNVRYSLFDLSKDISSSFEDCIYVVLINSFNIFIVLKAS